MALLSGSVRPACNTVVYGAPSPASSGNQIAIASYGGDISLIEEAGQVVWSSLAFWPEHRYGVSGIFALTQCMMVVWFLQLVSRTNCSTMHDRVCCYGINRLVALRCHGLRVNLVFGDDYGRLYALRRNDGVVRWVVELPGALPKGCGLRRYPRYVGPIVVEGKNGDLKIRYCLALTNSGNGKKTLSRV